MSLRHRLPLAVPSCARGELSAVAYRADRLVLRLGLFMWAICCGLHPHPGQAADEAPQTASPRIELRRVKVPWDRPKDWPSGERVPIPLDEFEAWSQAQRDGQPLAPSPRILQAEYRARFEGAEWKGGSLSWQVVAPESPLMANAGQPGSQASASRLTGWLPLGKPSLAVSDLKQGMQPVVWGAGIDGASWLVLEPGSRRLEGRWTLVGQECGPAWRFELSLPPALSSKLVLGVPRGARLYSSAGRVTPAPIAGDAAWSEWTVELGTQTSTTLLITSLGDAQDLRTPTLLYTTETALSVRPESARFQTDLRLTARGAPIDAIEIALPLNADLTNVSTVEGSGLNWKEAKADPQQKWYRISLPRPLADNDLTLRLRGFYALTTGPRGEFVLPQVTNAAFLDGQLAVRLEVPLPLLDFTSDGCRLTSLASRSGEGEVLIGRQLRGRARISVTSGTGNLVAEARVGTVVRQAEQPWTAEAVVHWTALSGSAFSLSCQVPGPWIVSDVQMDGETSADDLSEWSIANDGRGPRRLVLRFLEALSPKSPKKVRVFLKRSLDLIDGATPVPRLIPDDFPEATQHLLAVGKGAAAPRIVTSQGTQIAPISDLPDAWIQQPVFRQAAGQNPQAVYSLPAGRDELLLSSTAEAEQSAATATGVVLLRNPNGQERWTIRLPAAMSGQPGQTFQMRSDAAPSEWKIEAPAGTVVLPPAITPVAPAPEAVAAAWQTWTVRPAPGQLEPIEIRLSRTVALAKVRSLSLILLAPGSGTSLLTTQIEARAAIRLQPTGNIHPVPTVASLAPAVTETTAVTGSSGRPSLLTESWQIQDASAALTREVGPDPAAMGPFTRLQIQSRMQLFHPSDGRQHLILLITTPDQATGTLRWTWPQAVINERLLYRGEAILPSISGETRSLTITSPARDRHPIWLEYDVELPRQTASRQAWGRSVLPLPVFTAESIHWLGLIELTPGLELQSLPDQCQLLNQSAIPSLFQAGWFDQSLQTRTVTAANPMARLHSSDREGPVVEAAVADEGPRLPRDRGEVNLRTMLSGRWNHLAAGTPGTALTSAGQLGDSANWYLLTGETWPARLQVGWYDRSMLHWLQWLVGLLVCLAVALLRLRPTSERRKSLALLAAVLLAMLNQSGMPILAPLCGAACLGLVTGCLLPRRMLRSSSPRTPSQAMSTGPGSAEMGGSTRSFPSLQLPSATILFLSAVSLFCPVEKNRLFAQPSSPRTAPAVERTVGAADRPVTGEPAAATNPRGAANPTAPRRWDVLIPIGPDGTPAGTTPLAYVPVELFSLIRQQQQTVNPPAYLISRCVVQPEADASSCVLKYDLIRLNPRVATRIPVELHGGKLVADRPCEVDGQPATLLPNDSGTGFWIDLPPVVSTPSKAETVPDKSSTTEPTPAKDSATSEKPPAEAAAQDDTKTSRPEPVVDPATVPQAVTLVIRIELPRTGSFAVTPPYLLLLPASRVTLELISSDEIPDQQRYRVETAAGRPWILPARIGFSGEFGHPRTVTLDDPGMNASTDTAVSGTNANLAPTLTELWELRGDWLMATCCIKWPVQKIPTEHVRITVPAGWELIGSDPSSLLAQIRTALPGNLEQVDLFLAGAPVPRTEFRFQLGRLTLPQTPASLPRLQLELAGQTVAANFRMGWRVNSDQRLESLEIPQGAAVSIPAESLRDHWPNLDPVLWQAYELPRAAEITARFAAVQSGLHGRMRTDLQIQSDRLLWTTVIDIQEFRQPALLYRILIPSSLRIRSVLALDSGIDRSLRWSRLGDQLILLLADPAVRPQQIVLTATQPWPLPGEWTVPDLMLEGLIHNQPSEIRLWKQASLDWNPVTGPGRKSSSDIDTLSPLMESVPPEVRPLVQFPEADRGSDLIPLAEAVRQTEPLKIRFPAADLPARPAGPVQAFWISDDPALAGEYRLKGYLICHESLSWQPPAGWKIDQIRSEPPELIAEEAVTESAVTDNNATPDAAGGTGDGVAKAKSDRGGESSPKATDRDAKLSHRRRWRFAASKPPGFDYTVSITARVPKEAADSGFAFPEISAIAQPENWLLISSTATKELQASIPGAGPVPDTLRLPLEAHWQQTGLRGVKSSVTRLPSVRQDSLSREPKSATSASAREKSAQNTLLRDVIVWDASGTTWRGWSRAWIFDMPGADSTPLIPPGSHLLATWSQPANEQSDGWLSSRTEQPAREQIWLWEQQKSETEPGKLSLKTVDPQLDATIVPIYLLPSSHQCWVQPTGRGSPAERVQQQLKLLERLAQQLTPGSSGTAMPHPGLPKDWIREILFQIADCRAAVQRLDSRNRTEIERRLIDVESRLQPLVSSRTGPNGTTESRGQQEIPFAVQRGSAFVLSDSVAAPLWSVPVFAVRSVRLLIVGALLLLVGQLLRRWRFFDWIQSGFWRSWLILTVAGSGLFATEWTVLPFLIVLGLAIAEHLLRWWTAPPSRITVN